MKLPYKISRTLKRYESKHGRQVMIRVRMIGGKDFEVPVYDTVNENKFPISIKSENWYNGYAIGGEYHIPVNNINQLIDHIEKKVSKAMFTLMHRKTEPSREKVMHLTYSGPENFRNNPDQNEIDEIITNYHKGAFISEEEFLNFISNSEDSKYKDLKRELGLYEKNSILDIWDDFLKEYGQGSYKLSKRPIKIYIDSTGDDCIVTKYDDHWLERYFKYLAEKGYLKGKPNKTRLPYKQSTLEKYLKYMWTFGDYLFEKRVIVDQKYRRFTLVKK